MAGGEDALVMVHDVVGHAEGDARRDGVGAVLNG